jgi:predicted TIM-barrel fold metal-dependent hydrolase
VSELRFFDCNCMIGRMSRPNPVTIKTLPELRAELDHFRIDEALVCGVEAAERWTEGGNRAIAHELAGDDKLHPAWVLPVHTSVDFPNPARTVEEMLSLGVRAVRMWPSFYHGYLVEEWALGPLWRELAAHRVPVLIADGDLSRYPDQRGVGFSAQNLHDICSRYPTLPIVALRLNFSATRIVVPLLRACPNLHVEISYYTAHRGVDFLVQRVGAERVLFGSGLPWGSPGPGVVATRYAGISEDDRRLIAGDNLRRLLGSVM